MINQIKTLLEVDNPFSEQLKMEIELEHINYRTYKNFGMLFDRIYLLCKTYNYHIAKPLKSINQDKVIFLDDDYIYLYNSGSFYHFALQDISIFNIRIKKITNVNIYLLEYVIQKAENFSNDITKLDYKEIDSTLKKDLNFSHMVFSYIRYIVDSVFQTI